MFSPDAIETDYGYVYELMYVDGKTKRKEYSFDFSHVKNMIVLRRCHN